MKFFIANIILILLNSYVVSRLARHLPINNYKFSFLLIVLSITAVQDIVHLKPKQLQVFEQFFNSEKVIFLIYQASYLLFGIMTSLFIYILIMDIIGIILKLSVSSTSSLYVCFGKFYLTIISMSVLITIIGGVIEVVKGPIIEEVEIPIKNLPVSFDNFRIIQISDLHVGKIIKRNYVLNVVNIANSLDPNLIVLTGDFVDGSVQELRNDISPLGQLKSSHGIFFVTGNHEYYSGVDQWIKLFTNFGIKVLSNEYVLIKHMNEHVILAGVTDYSTIRTQSPDASSPSKALLGAPKDLVKVLLAHQPASYIEAHKAGYNLQLSGHTHAGQYFPFTILIRFFHRYYKGLNYHEGMWIYINRGTGYWGPPLRLGAPPEITLIKLKSVF